MPPDRLPPHSLEAEAGVLGCILQAPAECLSETIGRFGLVPGMFFDLRHRLILQMLVTMQDGGQAIDLLTLRQRLSDGQQLEAVGGLEYLSSLPDQVPSAANLEYYAEIVREKHLLRSMLKALTGGASAIYESTGEPAEILDTIERDVLAVANIRSRPQERSMSVLVRGQLDVIEEMHVRQGQVQGLATGFVDIDKMTNGLQPSQLIILAARPSMGKTSLALNIADHIAVELAQPVGFFSLETTAEKLVQRLLCARARVNHHAVRSGSLLERDFPQLTIAASKLLHAPLYIDDATALSILELRARARRMAQQHGIKLLIVDYLQLLNSTNARAQNRQQEIADVSSGLKALAKELAIPILALAQLSRLNEREKRGPHLSDLRESGALEQDADIVALLHAAKDERDKDAFEVELLIEKNKDGPTGLVRLTFLKTFTRFESAAKISHDDVPETYQPYKD